MERLKKLRKGSGVTQEQLANDLDVAKSTIGMWENKKREPDLTMLGKIADYFKTSVDFLLGRSDDPQALYKAGKYEIFPNDILECFNGDIEKAVKAWENMYDINSVLPLSNKQYFYIMKNIQYLSYKMGETHIEAIVSSGLDEGFWYDIQNHLPRINVVQLKALAIHFHTTIKDFVNTFIPKDICGKLRRLREEKYPERIQFLMRTSLTVFVVTEIEDATYDPYFEEFLAFTKGLEVDGRELIEYDLHTNIYNPLVSLSAEEAAMLEDYRKLNAEGRSRASQYIEDLVAGGRFTNYDRKEKQ